MTSRNSRIEVVPMPRTPSEFPVIPLTVEFRDPETKRFLDGSHALHQAGGVLSKENPVVQAVKEFEDNNSFVSMHAVGKDGKFYTGNVARAYDNYLALSHMDDLQQYIPQMEDLANMIIDDRARLAKLDPVNLDVPSQKEALLPFLTQIHLAKANGVSPEKIDFMVKLENNNPALSVSRMNMVRNAFESGQSIKEVESYVGKPYELARALQVARNSVNPEQFNILLDAKDFPVVDNLAYHLRRHDIPNDVLKEVVNFNNKLSDNPDIANKLPTYFREEGTVDLFADLSNTMNITPKEVEMLGNKILNTGKAISYDEAVKTIGAVRDLQGLDKTVKPIKAWEPKVNKDVKSKGNDEPDR